MKNLQQLPQNDLSELACLVGRIQQQIETFIHCSDSADYQKIKKSINAIDDKISKEIDHRQD